jgi:hypothetical protein
MARPSAFLLQVKRAQSAAIEKMGLPAQGGSFFCAFWLLHAQIA